MHIHVVPLFCWLLEIIFLFRYQTIYYYMQTFPGLLRSKRPSPVRIIVIDQGFLFFLLFYLGRLIFFFYCLFLILFDDILWEPASMLLILSGYEQLAVFYQIPGMAIRDPKTGIRFPTHWFMLVIRACPYTYWDIWLLHSNPAG